MAAAGRQRCPLDSPLCGGIRAVERVSELDDGAVPVLQDPVVRRVVIHQLRQRGELLPAVQVVVVARVLDSDVGHHFAHPAENDKRPSEGFPPPPDDKQENFAVDRIRTSQRLIGLPPPHQTLLTNLT